MNIDFLKKNSLRIIAMFVLSLSAIGAIVFYLANNLKPSQIANNTYHASQVFLPGQSKPAEGVYQIPEMASSIAPIETAGALLEEDSLNLSKNSQEIDPGSDYSEEASAMILRENIDVTSDSDESDIAGQQEASNEDIAAKARIPLAKEEATVQLAH